MKKKIEIFFIAIFCCVLIMPTLLSFSNITIGKEKLEEKRTLETFPRVMSNDFFTNIESWYDDHAPYRLNIITLQKQVSQHIETAYRKWLHPTLSAVFQPWWYSEEQNEGRKYIAPLVEESTVYGTADDWLFYTGEESLDFYQGKNLLQEEDKKRYASVVQQLYDYTNARGIKIAILFAPDKEQIYTEYMPSYEICTETKRVQDFTDYLREYTDAAIIYPVQELLEGKQLGEVYYRQDTHWNKLGAFIGLRAVYKTLNEDKRLNQSFSVDESIKYGGDLTNFSGFATSYTDYSAVYNDRIEYSMENVNDWVQCYNSNTGNGRKALLIGDSFREYMTTYLAHDFSEVSVFHTDRIFHEEMPDIKILKEKLDLLESGDVIIFEAVERYDVNNMSMVELVSWMLDGRYTVSD